MCFIWFLPITRLSLAGHENQQQHSEPGKRRFMPGARVSRVEALAFYKALDKRVDIENNQ